MAEKLVILEKRSNVPGVSTENPDHGTKSAFLKNPDAGKLPTFAGDFELQKLTLTTPNRKGYINLKAAWSDLNIYEDMFANSLTGSIRLVDGIGLMESVPIIGEETINIKIKTAGLKREREENVTGPFAGSQNEGIIDIKFRVVKISDITKLNEGTMTYTLALVSEEYILNLKQKVKKTSLDPVSLEPRRVSSVVRSIYKQFFEKGRSGVAKKIFIEPTKNPTNLIIPNYTPFKAFNFLAGRAVSAGKHAVGSSYVFYENIKGFFFISMETLMAGGGTGYTAEAETASPEELVYTPPESPVKETYVVQPKRLRAKGDNAKNVAIEMTAVDSYQFSSNFDVLENIRKGMYTNTLLTHDLVRMTYEKLEFDYFSGDDQGSEVIIDEETGGVEVKDYAKAAKDARSFYDTFTHLEKGRLCTPNQTALRKNTSKEEALLCFYPTNFGHDVVFKEDLGAEGVRGSLKSSLNIIPNRVEQWMQSRLVQSQQVNNIKLNIRAAGLSTRTVGDLIEFKMPTTFVEDRDGITQSQQHKYLSGYYLITKLRHHFTTEKYEIEFEAIKDSLKSSVGDSRESAVAQDPSTL